MVYWLKFSFSLGLPLEFLPQNLCFCQLFLCFCFLSLAFCYPVTPCMYSSFPFLSLCQNFALIPSLAISVFWLIYLPFSPFILSSLQKKWEEEREYTSRKLLSHTVQEGDSMSKIKQCTLTTQWMRSPCLSPTASFLPLHSLNLSISSIPPPPLSLFLHFQSAVTLVYPAWIPLQPSKPYQPKQQQQHQ